MAQPPAVVIVARHGMRLDAADQSWHLSTPTPYDPPLTYGGWKQCRALGVRIASLLHAREQRMNSTSESTEHGVQKRRKRKHKVVIHTSPFLRCLQTSVAISAGLAQYEPPTNSGASSATRSPSTIHSASPRLRAKDGPGSPTLAPIAEPRHDLQRDLARRALGEPKPRYRKSKIRVDAWLGEWLNPSYFDQITPPPPSSMMVAGAKAELMQNDAIDMYTPTLSHKSSGNSLWGGANGRVGASKKSTLDDWSHVTDALDAPRLRRERSNSASSVDSNDSDRKSASGRKSPFRPGHALQRLTSYHQPQMAVYHPPTPSYAISSSDFIPKGYVAHAKNAAVNVDYSWDSSRAPQEWGSGGEYGEEWSSMHRRFRKGLKKLIQWYSQHHTDDRAEDALGLEQADKHHEDEEDQEDLVVILVTHGAGSNALIGALTNQPVLLDVGMASLTMAVRKKNAPPLDFHLPASPAGSPSQSPDPTTMDGQQRSNLDIGLSAAYDMQLVASSEHLRPGADPTKVPTSSAPTNMRNAQEALARYKRFGATAHGEAGAGIESTWDLNEPGQRRSNTNSSLGSIRRPSASSLPPRGPSPANLRANTLPPGDRSLSPSNFTPGLWTPPSGRGTPHMTAQKIAEERKAIFTQLNDGPQTSFSPVAIDFAQSPPDSRPTSSSGPDRQRPEPHDSVHDENDDLGALPPVGGKLPVSLSRGLSQKGLWGNRPSGDRVIRRFADAPKRRWTVSEND